MPLVDTRELEEREPKPGWHGRFFSSQGMTFAYYRLDAGASLHEHSHPQEEVWNVLSGELEITIGGDRHRAGPGGAALVPPHTAHSVRALAASAVIVVDAPLRGEIGGGARAALAIRFADGAPLAAGPLALPYELCNQGRTPATLLRVDIESRVAPQLPPPTRTEIPASELPLRTLVAGGAVLRGEHGHAALAPAELERVRAGRAVLYLRGAVYYEDAEGERHHTTFCRVVGADGRQEPPASPGYNYGD